MIPRPPLGPVRARHVDEQPIPLRAEAEIAEAIARLEGQYIEVQGVLRRRFYSRDGEQRWGQVELWVSHVTLCAPVETDRRT